MTARDFYAAVRAMRRLQKQRDSTGKPPSGMRDWERRVDAALEAEAKTPDLPFQEPGDENTR